MAILDGGPVSVGFIRHSDFSPFSGDGVYISDQKTRKGAYAITLFGWGVKDGVKFCGRKIRTAIIGHTQVPKAFLNFYAVKIIAESKTA